MIRDANTTPLTSRKLTASERVLYRILQSYFKRKGYRFTRAENPEQEMAACLYAKKVFDQSGFYESADEPEPPEENGATSTYFLAWKNDELVGTLELVQHLCELPVEVFFNFDFPNLPRQNVAELTRFAVAPEHRGRNPVVAVGLLSAALRFSIDQEIRWWIGCTQSFLLQSFNTLFQDLKTLPEKPPAAKQIRFRKGRDGFFAPSRALRIFLIDTWSVSFADAGKKMIMRRLQAKKRRYSKTKPSKTTV